MSSIDNLPSELQNKIFYYYAEHPCAEMIKAYQPPFMKYPTIGTCQICERHGRKLNLEIRAYSGDYVCISCNNSYPSSREEYCTLGFLVDNEIVNDSYHSSDSDDDFSDGDDFDDDDDDDD